MECEDLCFQLACLPSPRGICLHLARHTNNERKSTIPSARCSHCPIAPSLLLRRHSRAISSILPKLYDLLLQLAAVINFNAQHNIMIWCDFFLEIYYLQEVAPLSQNRVLLHNTFKASLSAIWLLKSNPAAAGTSWLLTSVLQCVSFQKLSSDIIDLHCFS